MNGRRKILLKEKKRKIAAATRAVRHLIKVGRADGLATLNTMKVTKPKAVVVSRDVSEPVSRIKAAFQQLGQELLSRNAELDALRLALVTHRNLLLDGLHGTAKSMLVSKVFSRVTGSDLVVYRKQLMKGTQPDELFGPMNAKKYREDAIWEHNTDKMLPEAHLAFLDEVYRGSDMLLPSILGILNEKEFVNGAVLMKCPLITAVGTTNFITHTSELEAFNDRWLFRVKVTPLANSVLRIQLLNLYASAKAPTQDKQFSLADLYAVNAALPDVGFATEAIDLYEETVSVFRRKMNNLYISDRRLCLTLDVMRAQALFDNPEEPEVTPEHVAAAIHSIAFRNTGEDSEFTSAAESVVGSYVQYQTETADVKTLEEFMVKMHATCGSGATKQKLVETRDKIRDIYLGVQNMPQDERPKKAENLNRLEIVVNDMSELLNRLEEATTTKKR